MPTSSHDLLLTGVPGVGKTTVIRHLAQRLVGKRLAGFYTEEIREAGARQRFRLLSFDDQERCIAHVDLPKRYRVGQYGVDVAAIDAAAAELLMPKADRDIYLVDEIGKMACFSGRLLQAGHARKEPDVARLVVFESAVDHSDGACSVDGELLHQ